MATKKTDHTDADTALKTLELLQELVWAIHSRDASELSEGVSYLRNLTNNEKNLYRKPAKNNLAREKQSDLKVLVGSMSLVLADAELFPTNESIAKFAFEALHIKITRWEKRSRYEMIGMLIMESINASPERLHDVGNLFNKISNESESMEKIKINARKTGFSWNEAIRSLWTSVE